MDITITGRGVGIPDRFEDYASEKAEKVGQLAEKALALEIKVVRHHETNGRPGDDRVELTLIGPGPVVRAEANVQAPRRRLLRRGWRDVEVTPLREPLDVVRRLPQREPVKRLARLDVAHSDRHVIEHA